MPVIVLFGEIFNTGYIKLLEDNFGRMTMCAAIALFMAATCFASTAFTWDPDMPLSQIDDTASTLSQSFQRAIAVSQNGRIHVVWDDGRVTPDPDVYYGVWYKYSDNIGSSWSNDAFISPSLGAPYYPNYTNTSPSIAIIYPDQIHVLWDGVDEPFMNGYVIYGRLPDNGESWSEMLLNKYWSAEMSGFNSLSSNLTDYLMFYDEQWVPQFLETRLLGLLSTDNGSAWNDAGWHGFSTVGKSDYAPCTACDTNNVGCLVWSSVDSLNRSIVLFGLVPGGESKLVPYPGSGSRTNAYIESNFTGKLYVVWSDTRDGNGEIYFKKSTSGAWTSDTRLTNTAGNSNEPVIVLGAPGKIYLVWTDNSDGNYELYFKYSEDDGLTWSSDAQLTDSPGSRSSPHIAISPTKDMIYVAWNDTRDGNNEVYFKRGVVPIGINESVRENRPEILKVNPTISRTGFRIAISGNKKSFLRIFDAGGREFKVYSIPTNGLDNVIIWNGMDDRGYKVPAGIYFIELEESNYKETRKATILK